LGRKLRALFGGERSSLDHTERSGDSQDAEQ
jgi:hypothetical protein